MKPKHLAFFGAALLIVFCCVFASGCTTTQQTAADEKIVGNWIFPYDKDGITGKGIEVINKDGTGFYVVITEDGRRILMYEQFTWKKTGDNTCLFTFTSDNKQITQTYDSKTDTYTHEPKEVHKRLEPITGIWFTEKKKDDGTTAKYSISLYPDGNGCMFVSEENGTSQVFKTTWTKNSDGTYTILRVNGEPRVWTLDSTKLNAKSTTGNEYTKKYSDFYYYLSILGPWYDAENNHLATYNADGTGTVKIGDTICRFTWTIPEFGVFKHHILDGEYAGQEVNWIYDRTADTFTNPKNTVYVRPVQSMNGVTIIDSASSSSATATDPIVGQWGRLKSIENGKTIDAILTLRNDGEGYWMALGNFDGIQITEVNKDTWKKTGENTYVMTNSKGKIFNTVYNPAADTFTQTNDQTGERTYTRLDPIVGIWSGIAPPNLGGGDATTIIKPDGTGILNVANDNGTVRDIKITWTKNADGTYELLYSDGAKQRYTVDSSGKTMRNDKDSRTKTKEFLDTSFLMSIIGPWYSKDTGTLANFNADGTGFLNTLKGIIPFTWRVSEIGKFEVTYTGGTWSDGTSAKGKVSVWTYDRDNNEFISPEGNKKHVRLNESIEGKLILS